MTNGLDSYPYVERFMLGPFDDSLLIFFMRVSSKEGLLTKNTLTLKLEFDSELLIISSEYLRVNQSSYLGTLFFIY